MSLRKAPDPAPKALPPALVILARQLSRLPGVGEKSGIRMAIQIVMSDQAMALGIEEALQGVRTRIGRCSLCGGLAEKTGEEWLCAICRDHHRDASLLCVVGRLPDLIGIERSGAMRGRYFVLGKLLSPLEGVEAEDLPLGELRTRLLDSELREILIATPTSVEGHATALLLARELQETGLKVTRLASGVPHGGALEETDVVTLGQAIAGRQSVL